MIAQPAPWFTYLLKHLLKLTGRSSWMVVLVWMAIIAPAQAALELRVSIKRDVSSVRVGSSTNAVVRDGSGRLLGELQATNGFEATRRGSGVGLDRFSGNLLSIDPKTPDGVVYIGDRWYHGRTVIVPTNGGITAINYVDMEKYLASVLGGEMNANWPMEALKAQAVAARSFALFRRQRDGNGVFDLGNTTQWQVYKGLETTSANTLAAAQATAGEVLVRNNAIIEALFHSSSGGHTENSEDVWSTAVPYLRGVPDFDQEAPVYSWSKTFDSTQISNSISGVGNVVGFEPIKLTPNSRVMSMRVLGDRGSKIVTGATLREALGLRSTLFAINPIYSGTKGENKGDDKAGGRGYPSAFVINGRGFGHGLGMSQYGAYGMARQGRNYQDIVRHYFQSSNLAKIDVK